MRRILFCSTLGFVFLALLAAGCGMGSTELDEAYARGYADGVASVEDGQGTAGQTYEQGYADGLADAAGAASEEVCQRCYGLGYTEGYQAGLAAITGTAKPEVAPTG